MVTPSKLTGPAHARESACAGVDYFSLCRLTAIAALATSAFSRFGERFGRVYDI